MPTVPVQQRDNWEQNVPSSALFLSLEKSFILECLQQALSARQILLCWSAHRDRHGHSQTRYRLAIYIHITVRSEWTVVVVRDKVALPQ